MIRLLKHSALPYNEQGEEIPIEKFTARAAAGLHTTLGDLIKFAKASNEVLYSLMKPLK